MRLRSSAWSVCACRPIYLVDGNCSPVDVFATLRCARLLARGHNDTADDTHYSSPAAPTAQPCVASTKLTDRRSEWPPIPPRSCACQVAPPSPVAKMRQWAVTPSLSPCVPTAAAMLRINEADRRKPRETTGAAVLRLPGGAAITGGQDEGGGGPAITVDAAHRPAVRGVNEVHRLKTRCAAVVARVLYLPGGATIASGQDDANVTPLAPQCPAMLGIDEADRDETRVAACLLFNPRGTPIACGQDECHGIPVGVGVLEPTAQPCTGSTKLIELRCAKVPGYSQPSPPLSGLYWACQLTPPSLVARMTLPM